MCGKQRIEKIHGMVERVKDDGKASVEYMKIFERERMLREEGVEQGREEERQNTERERQRADQESQRADQAEAELAQLKEELKKLKSN